MSKSKPEDQDGSVKNANPLIFTNKISRRAAIVGMAGAGVALVKTANGQIIQKAAAQKAAADKAAAAQAAGSHAGHNHGPGQHGMQQKRPEVPDDPTKVLGGLSTHHGLRSPFEQLRRTSQGSITGGNGTPHEGLYGLLTPADLHFERNHAGVPLIDPLRHELLIHGMVDRPMVFTLADLKRMPAVSRIYFLECGGNTNWNMPAQVTPGNLCALFSQSEWTGVMLSTLFREVGVKPKATWFLAEGSDAAVLTRSIPVEKAMEDAMIVYGQNGEAVRPSNGYPMRLLLPGWEGNANIKWIRRIELSDGPFQTRQETSRYTEPLPSGKIRQFSFVQDARSLITFPAFPNVIQRGWVEIRGFAYSGRGTVKRVEVTTNSGKTWQPAKLQPPLLPKAAVRFTYLWKWEGKKTGISSRVIDDTGYMQPTRAQLKKARGTAAGYMYHANPITAWEIRRNGQVVHWPYFLT